MNFQLQLFGISNMILLAGIFSFALFSQQACAGDDKVNQEKNWYDRNWAYREAITIDNKANTSELTDYQVKVTLNSDNFDFAKAQSDGSDIRITDADATTIIPYFIAEYDPAGKTAVIWVKVPIIPASSEKTIHIYYGNSSSEAFDVPPLGHFDKYPSNAILLGEANALPENIVYDEDTGEYWMLYGFGARLAHSKDLVDWTDYGSIIEPSNSGWDAAFFDAPHLLAHDGKYYLYYEAYNASPKDGGKGKIGLAIASKITGPYIKYSGNPILENGPEGAWDSFRVDEPYVFQKEDGTWIMFFMAETGLTDEQIGYATAPALEGPWTKYENNPVIEFGSPGTYDALTVADPLVYKFGDIYYIFYSASHTKHHPWVEAYVTTTDLIHYTKHNIVLGCGNKDDWDADNAHRGAITRFGDYYYFPYTGRNDTIGGGYKAGLAKQYAKSTASGYPADQVLGFYDDFSEPTLKSHLRISTAGSKIDLSEGSLTVNSGAGASNIALSIQEFGPGHMIESKARYLNAGKPEGNAAGIGFAIDPRAGIISPMSKIADTGYHLHKVIWKDASAAKYQVDDSSPTPIASEIPIGTLPLCLFISAPEGDNAGLQIDYVIVRKYTNPEPSVSVGLK